MKFLLAPLLALFVAGCGPADPIPRQALAWANSHFSTNPIARTNATAGGWLFRGAREHRGELRVGYLIPAPMAGSASKRHAVLRLACPPRHSEFWQMLPSENDLVIAVWTQDNEFKDDVTC